MGFTLPEDVLGVPLYVPSQHNYFEVEDGGLPNGDANLLVRGDLSTDYKAIIRAPTMPVDIFNQGDLYTGRSWAMSCWLKLANLVSLPATNIMLGCSGYGSNNLLNNARNTTFPFVLGMDSAVNMYAVQREPLNSISSPASSQTMLARGSWQGFQDYWFLFVVNMITSGVSGAYTPTISTYMDTYNSASASDSAGGTTPPATLYSADPRYLHIGPYHNGGVGRPDAWRIGKWAFHDHALTIAERLAMWQAMYGTGPFIYTDNFNRATLGSQWWTVGSATPTIASDKLEAQGQSFRTVTWVRDLGTPNMYSQIVVHANGLWVFPCVRMAPYGGAGSATSWYQGGWYGGNNRWEIWRGNGTTLLGSTTGGAPTTPYTVRLEARTNGSGNVEVSLYHNGALKLAVTDTDASRILTHSNAGIQPRGNLTPNFSLADDFECGSLAA